MLGTGGGVLRDLLLTTEAITDEDGIFIVANSGKENAFAEGLGDLVFVLLEAEGTSHAAAAGVEELDLGPGGAEDLHLVLHAHGGVMMAVAVDDDLFVDLRWTIVRGMLHQKFAKEKCLIAKLCGPGIVGQKVGQLIAEDGGTAWFEDDDGRSGSKLRGEGVEDFEEILFGGV